MEPAGLIISADCNNHNRKSNQDRQTRTYSSTSDEFSSSRRLDREEEGDDEEEDIQALPENIPHVIVIGKQKSVGPLASPPRSTKRRMSKFSTMRMFNLPHKNGKGSRIKS